MTGCSKAVQAKSITQGEVVWMLFPIFVYVGLKDLRRRTAELDRTTKLCAHHLARAAADRDAAKIDDAPAQPEPGAESP